MKNNLLSKQLKQAYIALDGEHFNKEHFQVNGGRYLKMIGFIPYSSSARKILDIGCGYCYLTKFLKRQGTEVFGVDFYYGTVPENRCHQSGIPYSQLNIETDDLPFGENFFDVVLLGEVLEHFTHSPLVPLARIKNALRPGGRLILTTPNARRFTHLAKILLGQNIYPDLMSYYQEPYSHKGKDFYYRHNRLYTMKELHQLLTQAGFKTLSSGFVREGIYWKDSPKKILFKLLTYLILSAFPPFRDFLWVVAEKK